MAALNPPVTVCITGGAGQIAYSLSFMVAQGLMLGPKTPVILRLLDIPPMMDALRGVVMELEDCGLPLLHEVKPTTDMREAFTEIDVCLMVGAMPRKEGMERKDLLKANCSIFKNQGRILNEVAKKTVKVLVVGNPANTNALTAMTCAPSIPPENFSALTRLDHQRALAQIALRLGVPVSKVHNVVIWGNHSSTQYPSVKQAYVDGPSGEKVPVEGAINNKAWLEGEFIKVVQVRGAAVIKMRKLSSAMSAASAAVAHMRDWIAGSPQGEILSMAVKSDGSYGVPPGLIFSFPVTCSGGKWQIVQGLPVDDFDQKMLDTTTAELMEEKEQAFANLGLGPKPAEPSAPNPPPAAVQVPKLERVAS